MFVKSLEERDTWEQRTLFLLWTLHNVFSAVKRKSHQQLQTTTRHKSFTFHLHFPFVHQPHSNAPSMSVCMHTRTEIYHWHDIFGYVESKRAALCTSMFFDIMRFDQVRIGCRRDPRNTDNVLHGNNTKGWQTHCGSTFPSTVCRDHTLYLHKNSLNMFGERVVVCHPNSTSNSDPLVKYSSFCSSKIPENIWISIWKRPSGDPHVCSKLSDTTHVQSVERVVVMVFILWQYPACSSRSWWIMKFTNCWENHHYIVSEFPGCATRTSVNSLDDGWK